MQRGRCDGLLEMSRRMLMKDFDMSDFIGGKQRVNDRNEFDGRREDREREHQITHRFIKGDACVHA
jgi:hypothetical protein